MVCRGFRLLACLFAAAALPSSALAQFYPAAAIPEQVKKGSNAVVRYSETVFEYVNPALSKERNVLVVTVLGSGGESVGVFSESTDMFSSLSGFSGEIFDAAGKPVRKIKNSELHFSDYSGSNLADDNRTHYCVPSTPATPYTIKYEWEITTKNAVWCFPVFVPQPAESVGVEKAVYRLEVPQGTKFYTKAYNFDGKQMKNEDPKKEIYEWSVENLPPVTSEPFGVRSYEQFPLVYFSPDYFIYDGVSGSMKDWESYALWQWKLLDNRSIMPAELKAKVAELTANAETDMEKIRILYDYLAETTRYVSIQIGIGGFQPMSVAEVYRNKYGDCKALSNYMRSMLEECGIESYYTEIGMGRRSIPRDFANPAMSNHAIVMVPMAADTLWLECTNPELPLGYRHNSIVGQNGLVYKNGTAEVITVPRYDDSLNISIRRADVEMAADGSVKARVVTTNRLHWFEDHYSFGKKNAMERMNEIKSQINIPVAIVLNTAYSETKSPEPESVVTYDLEAALLGSRTGNRLFLNVMSFRKPASVKFGRSARKGDIQIAEGYCIRDITNILLPEGTFEIESTPPSVALDNKYGKYSMTVVQTGNVLTIERSLLLRTGTYGKSEFDEFRGFIEKIVSYDDGKIVMKNGQN